MSEVYKHYHVMLGNRDYMVRASDDVDAKLLAETWNTEYNKDLAHRFRNSDIPIDDTFEVPQDSLPLAYLASPEEERFQAAVHFSGKPAVTMVVETYIEAKQIVTQEDTPEYPGMSPLFTGNYTLRTYAGDDNQERVAHEILDLVTWQDGHAVAVGLIALTGARG